MVQGSPPLHWRKYAERYRLEGGMAGGEEHFPARSVHPQKGTKGKVETKLMPREGKIVSWTQVFSGAPTGFEKETPYFLAIVELPNRVRLITQIVDSEAEKVRIGANVSKVFRKISDPESEGHIAYGFKFKVAQ